MEGLRKLCEKKLFEKVQFQTATEILLLAKETQSTELFNETLGYIKK